MRQDLTTLGCARCGRALEASTDWSGWSAVLADDQLTGAVVCPGCTTDEERAETVIMEATTRTILVDDGESITAVSIPKDGET